MGRFTGAILLDEQAAPATPATGRVALYAKADGLVYSKDDAGVETLVSGGAGGGDNDMHILKTADQIFSTSSNVNDTTLFFPVAASKWYYYMFWIMYTVNAITTGARFSLFATGGSIVLIAESKKTITVPGTSSTDMMTTALMTGTGQPLPSSTAEPAATPTIMHARLEGVVQTNIAGNFGLTGQSEVAVANGMIIKAGSFCRYRLLG